MSATSKDEKIEKKFLTVTRSKDSIQTLSSWIITHKRHCDDICRHWQNVLEKSDSSHRLTLFYVANDVLQHCKKKNAFEYRVAFAEVLEDAVLLAKNDIIHEDILRIIKIWNERGVYATDYLLQLSEILGSKPCYDEEIKEEFAPISTEEEEEEEQVKAESSQEEEAVREKQIQENEEASVIIANFKLKQYVSQLDESQQIRKDGRQARKKLKSISDLVIPSKLVLQGKSISEDVKTQKKFDSVCNIIENYLNSAEKEVTTVQKVVKVTRHASLFYTQQNEEVKHVAHAYRLFDKKLKILQQKLQEKISTLPEPNYPPPLEPELCTLTEDEKDVITITSDDNQQEEIQHNLVEKSHHVDENPSVKENEIMEHEEIKMEIETDCAENENINSSPSAETMKEDICDKPHLSPAPVPDSEPSAEEFKTLSPVPSLSSQAHTDSNIIDDTVPICDEGVELITDQTAIEDTSIPEEVHSGCNGQDSVHNMTENDTLPLVETDAKNEPISEEDVPVKLPSSQICLLDSLKILRKLMPNQSMNGNSEDFSDSSSAIQLNAIFRIISEGCNPNESLQRNIEHFSMLLSEDDPVPADDNVPMDMDLDSDE